MQLPEPPPRRDLAGPTDRTPNKAGPALELIGGGLVLLGSFLPWASVATVFGTVSLNGIEGDGKITMVLGLVLVLIAVLELTGSADTRVVALVVAFIAVAIGGYDLLNAGDKLSAASNEYARASIGVGLYAIVGGGILAVVGGFMKR
jgi:hypothetical protein